MAISIGLLVLLYATYATVMGMNQRSLIFFPTHETLDTPLKPWVEGDQIIGYSRQVEHPRTVWLMAHGNAGQASQRAYVLRHLANDDSLFVLEYPGYGLRSGKPSMASMDEAAAEAYRILRRKYPVIPVCVIGESVGSGPASFLCTLPSPPDKVVLVVPFDEFARVASEHMPLLPVKLMLKDPWNNIDMLRHYKGSVVIYGAVDDRIIPVEHAKRLASSLSGATFVEIEGGHNDWSSSDLVRIEK